MASMRRCAPLTAVAVGLGLAGCGNAVTTEVTGRVGLQRDDRGDITVVIDTCRSRVSEIIVSAGRDGLSADQPNPTLGALRAATPQSGRLSVSLASPAHPWSVTRPLALLQDPNALVLVDAGDREDDTATSPVGTTVARIGELTKDQVIVGNDSEVVSVDRFHAAACP